MRPILAILALAFCAQAQFLNQGNMSIFRVGSKSYTHQDVDDVVNRFAAAKKAQTGKSLQPAELQQMRLMIVDQMVSMELIKLEAAKQGIKVSPKVLEQQFKMYKSQFPSAKAFQSFLKSNGLTESSLKSKMADQILPEMVMAKVIKVDRSMPSAAQAKAFYDSHRSMFPVNDSVMAARIMMKSTGADAKALLDGFAAQVRLKKAPFQMLAAQFSEDPRAKKTGGMMPAFRRGDFGPDCAKALNGLSTGELSRVCVGKGASHLFMMVGANDGRFESYKQRAMQAIMMKRQESYMAKFKEYENGLRAKYGVQYYDPSYNPEAAGGASSNSANPFKSGALGLPGVP